MSSPRVGIKGTEGREKTGFWKPHSKGGGEEEENQ